MSDQGPSSHWSSSREREERDRQRKEARERARQERLAREAAEAAGTPPASAGRRLTDDERRTIREFRFPSSSGSAPATRSSTSPPPPTEPPLPASPSSIGTRWRDSAPPPPPPDTGGGTLPDLPGDNGGRRRRGGGSSRLIIFGLALFALMAVVAFLPFGPLGNDDDPELPTPSATLPSIFDANSEGEEDDPQAEDTPLPGDGQPVVCIDAGHGGWDTGWERTEEGDDPYAPPIVTEADINLGMAWMLKEELEAQGMFVVMTRPSGAAVNMFDQDIDGDGVTRLDTDNPRHGDRDELQARINICNEAGADILISLHLNGADDREAARGYEIFYTAEREFGQQNADLATFLYRQLDTALRDTEMAGLGRGADPDTELEVEVHDFGSEEHLVIIGPAVSNNDYQIVPSAMPGAVVETVFLSNDLDAAWIVQPENQRLVIEAYVQGILDYFAKHPA